MRMVPPPMPKITICIDVADLYSGTLFYTEALGCTLETQRASHNTLDADGVRIHLGLKKEASSATPQGHKRNFGRHWTPVHLDFDVEDVEHTAEAVKRLGGTVEELKNGDWGSAAFCADPFGNGFCLLRILSDGH